MECIFCNSQMDRSGISGRETYDCSCPNCGHYRIAREAFDDLPYQLDRGYKEKKHLISGFLCEMHDLNLPLEVISTSNISYLVNNSKIPQNSFEKLDKLLSYINRKAKIIYEEVELNIRPGTPAIGYAKNSDEITNMISALKDLDYIKKPYEDSDDVVTVALTLKGIKRAESLQKDAINSKQAFVAMWFDEGMRSIFGNNISKAISEAGYNPFTIDMKEHNDDICDNIIAEIRKSRFLIADFTGHRGGVYFEAGFAYGLGIPVIWTCRKDWFEKVHFDIEHYNFIVWEDGEELGERLKNRILATIPKA